MKTKIKKATFFKILFSIFCLGIANNVLAIGMVTDPIIIESILRGGKISETITVFNPENKEVIYQLGANGQIKDWVEFFEIEKPDVAISKVNVPAKKYYDLIATIKIPEGTPNGEYTGEIFVKQDPKEQPKEGESSVSVSQMVSKEVKITVTDEEVVKLETTLIPETYAVRREEPIRIKIIHENFGNIILKPSFQLKITSAQDEKNVFNAIFPYPETEEAIKPGERKTMSVFEWQTTGQPKGRYIVEISTLIGDKVLDKKDFYFDIGDFSSENDSKSIKNKILAGISFIGRGNLTSGWLITGAILLILAKILLYFSKKSNAFKLNPFIKRAKRKKAK